MTNKTLSIRLKREAYMALIVLAAEASTKHGKPMSLNETINDLLIEQLNGEQNDNKNEG
jgi:hypothetical protein